MADHKSAIKRARQTLKKNEINKQIAEQKASGVDDSQMKGLYQKKSMLELVTNNQEVINMIGKPIIKKLLGVMKSL